ncbi:uncharacterized protein F5Z01DRAFT_649065 [Emericellopsis atlantica]|uniref:Uncharacterized protein n=1 Tax=Emericellopsis atlantica TaxID=2614577 RepID=A0A9P8CR92_9HYPO|nr:uncharacterized protein F5Z01DRAFT_649065 [Emericellopsis atlantica]KAG9256784.1 hypothetical protein F5Z01DRAFT_649065 [Emericellopsis atlantica]
MSEWKWFPPVKTDWSLDVVNLLVVIGETSIIEHAQPITASLLCVLPRIIPAPQVFLKPVRPGRMPDTAAKMTGVYSGTTLDSVGFFANIITPLDEMPALGFRVVEVRHSDKCRLEEHAPVEKTWWVKLLGSMAAKSKKAELEMKRRSEELKRASPQADEETGRTTARETQQPTSTIKKRHRSTRQTLQDLLTNPSMAYSGQRPAVPVHIFSPIHILGIISFFNSIAIIVCAVIWEDGNAILAVGGVSLMSSVVGFASFWRPLLMSRKHDNEVPDGDVMIRTREGAFVLVKCTEDVARELYSGTEECEYYVNGRIYRLLMVIGTVLLMLSVVLLGNCTWNSQVFIGASYIVLNGLYWALGMLPRSYFWDLSRYEWRDATPYDAEQPGDDQDRSYTRTLWYAIRETRGKTGWVRVSGAAPSTDKWKRWVKEAGRNAKMGLRDWDAVRRKDEIMRAASDDDDDDEALECAPFSQITRNDQNRLSVSMF